MRAWQGGFSAAWGRGCCTSGRQARFSTIRRAACLRCNGAYHCGIASQEAPCLRCNGAVIVCQSGAPHHATSPDHPVGPPASPRRQSQRAPRAFPPSPSSWWCLPRQGATDITMRVLADNASKILGQPVVVENKPGAGGTLSRPRPCKGTSARWLHAGARFPLGVRLPCHQDQLGPGQDISYVLNVTGYAFGVRWCRQTPRSRPGRTLWPGPRPTPASSATAPPAP